VKRAAILIALSACSDFATPSNLDRPQIIAVRSSPASLAPGESALLEVLVAGPDGVIDASAEWELLTGDATLQDNVLSTSTEVTGEVTVKATVDGLTAEKRVGLGEHRENPTIEIGDDIAVAPDSVVPLAADVSVADPRVTWYATCGEIERYRDAVTELDTGDEPCAGWVIAVGRDEVLGVGWDLIRIAVE
jgi:hypothetical protein